VDSLEQFLDRWRNGPPEGLARLHLLEHEFQTAMLETELDFVRRLRNDIEAGDLDGIDQWRAFHAHPPKGDT
jgi:hypothetical protein